MIRYPWPGNIRELETLVERMITLKQEGVISPSDLPEDFNKTRDTDLFSEIILSEEGINFSEMVLRFEKQILEQALLNSNGVKNRAAQLLQMNCTTLIERLQRRGIPIPF